MLKVNNNIPSRALIKVLALFLLIFFSPVHASVQDDIDAKNRLLEEYQRQLEEYQSQAENAKTQSKTLQGEIARLNAEINQVQLEIKSLGVSINKTSLEIGVTETKIGDAENKINTHKSALGQYIKIINENDQRSLTEILLKNQNLSDFFNDLNSIQTTQDNLKTAIDDIKDLKGQLEQHQSNLEEKQTELEQAKRLQEIEKRSIDATKAAQAKLLKDTQGKESKFQELAKKTQKDIQAIKAQVEYLLQGGLTIEDAISFAKLAAIGADIRPAFLLALLEVESRLGQNVGKGNWRDDMYLCYQRMAGFYPSKRDYYLKRAEDEKNAYFAIMGALGLDPDSQKVSREPSYGCGGAMGPAQFIPTTWLGYASEVSRITGHNPTNPWNFQDAFTASAAKLAKGGATSKEAVGEIRAAKAYISGNSKCSTVTCNSYANSIQRKATEIAKNL